jgi:hypothetical protein
MKSAVLDLKARLHEVRGVQEQSCHRTSYNPRKNTHRARIRWLSRLALLTTHRTSNASNEIRVKIHAGRSVAS